MPSPTAGLELDDSEDYSFANLTVSRTSAGTAVDKQQAADGSGASSFEVCYISALPLPRLVPSAHSLPPLLQHCYGQV